ncbi:MAG: Minf_1886 family protein [Candidatus Eisenbacteria bacterium]
MAKDLKAAIDRIRAKDPGFREEAYVFLLQSLDVTLERIGEKRHVTGRELLEGVRELALHRYGPTARMVFEHWGLRATEDFGRIVFRFVEEGILSKTEADSIEDFTGVFDFRRVFEEEYSWTADMDVPKRRLRV